MEKIKNRLVKFFSTVKEKVGSFFSKKSSDQTSKRDVQYKNIVMLFVIFVVGFVSISLFMPASDVVKFREVANDRSNPDIKTEPTPNKNTSEQSSKLWGSPSSSSGGNRGGSQPNYNTPMLILPHGGNSKLELAASTHLRIRIVDKFIASQEAVPVMGKVVEAATTESGLSIPEGSLLYGEASYQKSQQRAIIQFRTISYPSGEVRRISASVLSSDGMPGLEGTVHSDGMKNSAGQFITTFVGALAGGSMERDFMGNSRGGIQNGVLQAVSETAKNRAQKYGEGLKEAREWIEIGSGVECEAVINQTFKMLESEVGQ